jgi:hypothetical protein
MVSATILYFEPFLQVRQRRCASSGVDFAFVEDLKMKLGAKGGTLFLPRLL